MRPPALLPAFALAALLAGCAAVGPDYRRPDNPAPAAYAGSMPLAAGPVSRASADEADLSRWWTQFDDPVLQGLIDRALKDNLGLEAAASRIREARQQEILAGAAGQPTLGANASATHEHISKNAFPPGFQSLFGGGSSGGSSGGSGSAPVFALPGSGVSIYQLGFDASWEIDVFGGVRRAVESAHAQTEAAVWSRRDAEVTLAAEVASDYFQLRAAQRRIVVYQAEIERQQGLLTLINDRRRTGVATGLDIDRQQSQIADAAARLPPIQAEARAQVHALGVLVGRPPETLDAELATAAPLPVPPPVVPVGLPSDLLDRRPDVRRAERQLAAANARIGVATAELYPKFNLTGSAGLVSTALKTLLSSASRQYSGAAAIDWPILDGGRSRADIRIAGEQRRQAELAYRGAMLAALRDVEDALSRYAADQDQGQSLRQSLQASDRALTIARQSYQVGLVDFSDVLGAQAAVLNTQDQLAQNDAALCRDLASLYKALGGGWSAQDPTADSPVSSTRARP